MTIQILYNDRYTDDCCMWQDSTETENDAIY